MHLFASSMVSVVELNRVGNRLLSRNATRHGDNVLGLQCDLALPVSPKISHIIISSHLTFRRVASRISNGAPLFVYV